MYVYFCLFSYKNCAYSFTVKLGNLFCRQSIFSKKFRIGMLTLKKVLAISVVCDPNLTITSLLSPSIMVGEALTFVLIGWEGGAPPDAWIWWAIEKKKLTYFYQKSGDRVSPNLICASHFMPPGGHQNYSILFYAYKFVKTQNWRNLSAREQSQFEVSSLWFMTAAFILISACSELLSCTNRSIDSIAILVTTDRFFPLLGRRPNHWKP